MKLRIKGDNLRLRLTRSEVGQLASAGSVKQSMRLAGARLDYALQTATSANSLSAELTGASLVVSVPESQARTWAESDQVSLRGQDGPLQILVEKDFSCLQPREGEDDSDAFPHPEGRTHE